MFDMLFPGYRNLGLYSFNKYINGTDPDDFAQTYQYMNGLQANLGGIPYVTPDGITTLFYHAGDPTAPPALRGDVDFAPADRRMMQTTGPITFRPGDSTEIVAAIIVGRGGDRLSSINVMKFFDRKAQDAYERYFILPQPPAVPNVTAGILDGKLTLHWTDTSEVDHGDFPFEGYTVYQGASANGPWQRIANFDVTNGYAQIQTEVVDPQTGALERRAVKFGDDGGLKRYFVLNEDYVNGGPRSKRMRTTRMRPTRF
jgi:hypothetical protein